jgi:hypothetical protein
VRPFGHSNMSHMRIPTKPAMHSEYYPATHSNFIPAGIPI